MSKAACDGLAPRKRGDPDLFFPGHNRTQDANRAVLVCFSCPVRKECKQLKKDTDSTDGIWGGEY